MQTPPVVHEVCINTQVDAYYSGARDKSQATKLGLVGEFEDSNRMLTQSLQEHKRPETLFNLGCNLMCQNQFERAIVAFTHAIELNPNYAPAYNDRGLAYEALGKFQEATQDFQRSLKLRPNHTITKRNLAMAYYNLGFLDTAEKIITSVQEKPKPIKAVCIYGMIQEAKGKQLNWEQTKFYRRPPLNLETSGQWYWLAVATYHRGAYKEAKALVDAATKFRPDTLAIGPSCLLKLGDLNEAYRASEELLQKVPGAYKARLIMAKIDEIKANQCFRELKAGMPHYLSKL